jgi:alpha-D-ribose 1-methylphosphonate 5-triphosphate synthase subunit PhnG
MMKNISMLLAGGLLSAALVGGPAQASEVEGFDVASVCGEGYVLAGYAKVTGPSGQESLGKIVQTTNVDTHDACTFVQLKRDKGTTGTLTITTMTGATGTAEGTFDTTTVMPVEIDLAAGFTSAPSYYAFADVARVSVSADITGAAYQGAQHSQNHSTKVPASVAAKKQARAELKAALKAAKASLRKDGDKRRYAKKVKAANARHDAKVKDKVITTVTIVADKTPFTTSANLAFDLETAVPYVDEVEETPAPI